VATDERDQQIAQLEARLAQALKELAEALKENGALREVVEQQKRAIEEWKRGFRERRKRRTSRAEGKRRGTGKPRGRRVGHDGAHRAEPERIDQTVQHPVPGRCECGCEDIEVTDEVVSTVVEDIPPVRAQNTKHVARVGLCRRCKRRVVAPLPGAVKSGQSLAKAQVGPQAQAMAIELRFERKMTLEGICQVFGNWFGLSITPGGLSQMFDRTRDWSRPTYDEIQGRIRVSSVVGLDETGLRQDGLGAWAWLARTDEASLFRIELSRGAWVADQILGDGFVGVLCSDFYAAYTRRDDWTHAYCGAHVQREGKEIAELDPSPLTEAFRDRLDIWYLDAKRAQQSDDDRARRRIRVRLDRLVTDPQYAAYADIVRLQGRLDEHFEGVMTFVYRPDVPADNNRTEGDLRPLAVYRRVTGGTRSSGGSLTLAHWMSVTQTLHKNNIPLRDYVIGLYDAHLHGRAPPPIWPTN
jgi:transposase